MSNKVSLSGSDVMIINERVISDLGDGDYANMDFPNELATLTTGKNGNTIYSINNTGEHANVIVRVLRGSSDDKFLNSLMALQKANFAGFVLMTGEFIKKIGDGEGNIANDIYLLRGGIFTKNVIAKQNSEGDTEQSLSIYEMRFSRAPRSLT